MLQIYIFQFIKFREIFAKGASLGSFLFIFYSAPRNLLLQMVPSSPTFLSLKAKPPANIFNFRSSYQFERAIRRTISRRTIWLAIVIDKFFSVPRYAEKAHDRPTGRSFSCGNPNFLFSQLQRNSSITARMQSPSKQYSVAASYSSNFFFS